jgi:hypothetical protein
VKTNFDRIRCIVEELAEQAQKAKNIARAESLGKVLDEMNDLTKKYPENTLGSEK